MKKTIIAAALAMATSTAATAANFTMLDGSGGVVGVDNTTTDIRDFGTGTWTLSSPTPFFGVNWVAHSGTVYDAPGTYSFDTIEGGTYTVDLAAGYTMGHILFNWGATADIDVINIWDANGNSIDVDGDGISGLGMIDGAFIGFNANFSLGAGPSSEINPAVSAVPVPAAVWLFGSGLVGLVGVARRKKAA